MHRRQFLSASAGAGIASVLASALPLDAMGQITKPTMTTGSGVRPSHALATAATTAIAQVYMDVHAGRTPNAATAYALSVAFIQDQVETGQAAADEAYLLSHEAEFLSFVPSALDRENLARGIAAVGLPASKVPTAAPDLATRQTAFNMVSQKGLAQFYLDQVSSKAMSLPGGRTVGLRGHQPVAHLVPVLDEVSCKIIQGGCLIATCTGNVAGAVILGVWDLISC